MPFSMMPGARQSAAMGCAARRLARRVLAQAQTCGPPQLPPPAAEVHAPRRHGHGCSQSGCARAYCPPLDSWQQRSRLAGGRRTAPRAAVTRLGLATTTCRKGRVRVGLPVHDRLPLLQAHSQAAARGPPPAAPGRAVLQLPLHPELGVSF